MHGIKKWLVYGTFILVLSIFLIYFLFPSDLIKRHITSKVSLVNPNLKISIGRIRPTFPPGIRLKIVNLTYLSDSIIDADDIVITPRLMSVFSQKRSLLFKVAAHQGVLKGTFEVAGKNTLQQVYLDANITGIQLAQVPVFQSQLPFNLSGILNAKITYENRRESGNEILAKLEISDCEVETSTPFMNQNRFNLSRIEADLLINNDMIEIIQCNLEGAQFQAMVSGLGTLKDPLKKSIIDLSGTMRLHPSYLIGLKKGPNKSILGNTHSDGETISIEINGPLDNPALSLE
jgi:type II secretion system protein N